MAIPNWLYKWIEQEDEPITDTVTVIPDIGDINIADTISEVSPTEDSSDV